MKKPKTLSAYVGSVIRGEYKKRDMTLEDLAKLSGVPHSSLQGKISGSTGIFVQDLIRMCAALDISVQKVVDEALELFGGVDELLNTSKQGQMSAQQDNVTAIRSKDPRTMSGAEHDTYQGDRAAKAFDPNADRPSE